jgi:O-antigen/teichoic acid export membrane protein
LSAIEYTACYRRLSLIASLKARLPRNQFWRSLTIVAGGAALGQAASLLASPVLSRLYGPADFGLLAVYASVTSIGGVVSSLSYQLAIPVPKEDREAAGLSVIALLCVLSVGLLAAVGAAFARNSIDAWVHVVGFARYAWLLPLGVVGLGAYEVVSSWASRTKSFGALGRTSAERGLLQVGTQLAGGAAGLGPTGLVVGQLLGQWGGIWGVSRSLWRRDRETFRALRWKDLPRVALRYRRYPLLSVPAALLNALDANAAPLLFAHFFGAIVTGYFALGHRLLTIPFWLIGNSAQKVFFPAAAEAKHAGRLAEETDLTYRRLLCLVLPVVALLAASAPDLFTVLLGAKWREAGVYLQWISVRTCFTLVVFPLMPILYVMEKQAAGTLFNGLQLVVRVGAILIGTSYNDPRLSVMLLGTSTGLMWLVFLGYLLVLSGNSLLRAARRFGLEGGIACCLAAPIVVVKLAGASPTLVTAITVGLSLLGAALVLKRLRTFADGRA